MTGYIRNDTPDNIATGNVIRAADLDGEYDALVAAFNATTGHSHDGTAAEGGPITVIGPAQDIVASSGAIRPKTDNTYDLGTAVFEWKDLYIDGTAYIDNLQADSVTMSGGTLDNVVIGGTTPAAADFTTVTIATVGIDGGTIDGTVIGGVTPADGTFDNLNVDGNLIVSGGADISPSAHLLPTTDNVYDLGSATFEFRDLYIDGIAYIDDLRADTADINGGTIDGVTIGSGTFSGDLLAATVTSLSAPLSVTYGGTGTNSIAGIQSALNLDTMAYQSASSVAITGGSLSGVTISGYATTSWVTSQNYATQSYVTTQGYITSAALSGYATESWVNTRGFATTSSLGTAAYSSSTSFLSATSNDTTSGSLGTSGDLYTIDGTLWADVSTGSVGINTTSWNGNYALNIYPSDSSGGRSRLALWGNSGIGSDLYLLENTTSGSGVSGVYFGDNADQSVGWLAYSQSLNYLGLATNNIERFVIGSNGHVCISDGTDYTYDAALNIIESWSGRSWTPNSATELTVERDGNCFVDIISSGTTYSGINFSDAADEDVGRIWYEHPLDRFRFYAGTVWAATLSSTGFDVTGALSKGSGSFKIDHPLKPDTHHLVHSFVEGPQADNIYRGRVELVDGVATVNIDEAARMTEGTFVALNGNVQCFTSNETGWTAVRGKVEGNLLKIEAQEENCSDTISWLVIGERHDQHMLDTNWTDENGRVITEPEKEKIDG